ncbi:ribosomal-protein-alanine acetyltransferase [Methanolacinia petrolearia DSM 11571]|uniref:Ribosomal-protein-alanine acetyltransferase n=1 Tax=Methanolacinia petrolearia (strain DSM 11571 / OCM 486 / SEBR 4847) TaxID=679926 RepID=E1RHK8_METP4|nr:ribosomal protein S18-alanine N-acetyltransferase [Methanolacinia petrolearia]ADN35317.1 ribosomal-protein-alanine acetyltransferase [Methanolacinia petrolearia DSM 11571]
MNNVEITRAGLPDISRIVEIENNLFPDPWNEQAFRDVLFYYSNTFFTLKSDGDIVGFITAGIEDTSEVLYGHIMNLAVVPEYRKMGLGGRLMQRMEYEFIVSGAEGSQLEVRVSNGDAISFYKKLGYSQVMVIGGYYNNGEDAVLMMKWF